MLMSILVPYIHSEVTGHQYWICRWKRTYHRRCADTLILSASLWYPCHASPAEPAGCRSSPSSPRSLWNTRNSTIIGIVLSTCLGIVSRSTLSGSTTIHYHHLTLFLAVCLPPMIYVDVSPRLIVARMP